MNALFVGLIIFAVLGSLIFMSGYHAIDTAWNMKAIGSNSDINYFGRSIDANSLYSQGIEMSFSGFVISVVSCICMGVVNGSECRCC